MTQGRLEAVLPSKQAHLPMLTDVDTEDDLQHIGNEMPQDMNSEKKLIEWIKNHERPLSLHG